MAVVNRFINSMTSFVKLGFSGVAKGQAFSADNAAKSYQLRNSLIGDYPDISINYSAVRLTEGKLLMPENTAVFWENNGIRFNWTYHPIMNWPDRRSRAMVLVYEPDTEEAFYFLMAACMNENTQFLEMPPETMNKPVHAYLSFISEDQKRIATSKYFYVFNLPALEVSKGYM